MSDQALRLLVGGVLLLHGLGHGGAMGALAWMAHFGPSNTGGWTAARSWLVPSLGSEPATLLACAFWTASLLGFAAAALGFWGIVPIAAWRAIAVASASVSIVGIALFLGNWPAFNTAAALAVNAAVLVAILALAWPQEA